MKLSKILTLFLLAISIVISALVSAGDIEDLYKEPSRGVHTRWVSPENPSGAVGAGAITNKGAKGNAFYIIEPGEKKVLFDVRGAGIIKRIWMAGGISFDRRRHVRIDMYWDDAETPAVSAPIGDFFGVGLGRLPAFESALFASPEGRSFNSFIPMPFRKAARIFVTNESDEALLLWYTVNYVEVPRLPRDAMYFHAYWSRNPSTEMGKDFVILPNLKGKGRFIGTNVGLIGNPVYAGTWFGEGEVKIYLDGDKQYPTLAGTGTEDYVGSGFGQGVYYGQYFGSPVSEAADDGSGVGDIYAFYRYHIPDPVYFHKNIRVTLQQIGNSFPGERNKIKEMIAAGVPMQLIRVLDLGDENAEGRKKTPIRYRLLDMNPVPEFGDPNFPPGENINFYRQGDDLSATAYFYLDRAENNLPALPNLEVRVDGLERAAPKKATEPTE